MKHSCQWALQSPFEQAYHDNEWGVPLHDDLLLFEELCLGIFQAGLIWRLVLSKRDALRAAFNRFDPEIVSTFTDETIQSLMLNPHIIRNRKKIEATVYNARKCLGIQKKYSSLENFLWSFVEHTPIQNSWKLDNEVPCLSLVSEKMAKALKSEGFKFVGPKLCYGVMQAAGLVNDHTVDCYRYREIKDLDKM
jgi:DNA-3-methyladenine glycosylase I